MPLKRKHAPLKNAPRKFSYLPIIDRYLLREFLIPFTALLMAFILLFIIGDLFDDLRDFLEVDAPFSTTALYFLLRLPGKIGFILPITILLSCMYTMARLGKNHEITAMRASGISLMRCGGGIYIIALLLTATSFWFNEAIVPYSESEAYIIKKTAKDSNYQPQRLNWLSYTSGDRSRTWLFNKFSSEGIQNNVSLKKYRYDKTQLWMLTAETARHSEAGWLFRNVTFTEYDESGVLPLKDQKMDTYELSSEDCPETVEDILNSTKPADDLPSGVLWKMIKDSAGSLSEKMQATYKTIFFFRLSFPWSCLLAVLLGIPLAAKSQRKGIFGSIIAAIGLIILYQFSSQFCVLLGKEGVLPAFIAGAGPTILAISFALYKLVR